MPEHFRFRGAVKPTNLVKVPARAELPGETDGTDAKLYLYDVIDSWGGDWGVSAREFTAALAQLGDVERIRLHINSPGGEVYEGIAIMNALRRHPAEITAVVDGIAASAASFIAASADRVVMGQNTELMIHDAWGIALGPAADMHSAGDRLDAISNNIADVYAARPDTPGDRSSWRSLMLAETWFTAQEAVTAGLADEIEGQGAESLAAAENAFDLSVFAHAGRSAAPAPDLPVDEAEPDAPPADDEDRARRQRQNRNRLSLAQKRVNAVTR